MKPTHLFFSLALALVGCDGTATPASTDDTPVDQSWQDMDFEARTQYMVDVVMPAMQPEFEAYDGRYADFSCATCHGSGATDGTFAMPSDGPFPISMTDFPTGPGADFMAMTVGPMMADLLDVDPFDPNTGEGFGCAGCHVVQ